MEKEYCYMCMSRRTDGETCPNCGNMGKYEAPVHHLRPGAVLRDRYLIGKALGEGGFGITYVGMDLTLRMKIAVKEYYPHGLSNRNNDSSNQVTMSKGNHGNEYENEMRRFLSEARVLACFADDPGVVGVRDFFQENGTAYIVMEYLDGITLKNYLSQFGPIHPATLAEMIDPILRALQEIHNQNMIHRDISPDNIMMLKNGRLKLLDFGAARDVSGEKSLSVMLKPGYAPEEQYRSKGRQGAWTDVYAMCATIYKCITGITPDDAIQRVFEDELKKPSELGIEIPPRFEQALMQGLSVKIEHRIQTMDALRKAMSNDANDKLIIEASNGSENKNAVELSDSERTVYCPTEEEGGYTQLSTDTMVGNPSEECVPDETDSEKQARKPEGKTKATVHKKTFFMVVSGVVLVIAICLILVFGGKSDVMSMEESLPTERAMAGDCSAILKNENISGSVLSVDILNENLNEKFKIYEATCQITVYDGNDETKYTVLLCYEYDEDKWQLSTLSSIK